VISDPNLVSWLIQNVNWATPNSRFLLVVKVIKRGSSKLLHGCDQRILSWQMIPKIYSMFHSERLKFPALSVPANEKLDGATSILPITSQFGLLFQQLHSGGVRQLLKK
jgi:hypothetical protein